MRIWECRQGFALTSGEFNLAAESNLTKQGVRRTPKPGYYRFTSRVEGETHLDALVEHSIQLKNRLSPYGVEYDVREATAALVGLGE